MVLLKIVTEQCSFIFLFKFILLLEMIYQNWYVVQPKAFYVTFRSGTQDNNKAKKSLIGFYTLCDLLTAEYEIFFTVCYMSVSVASKSRN